MPSPSLTAISDIIQVNNTGSSTVTVPSSADLVVVCW